MKLLFIGTGADDWKWEERCEGQFVRRKTAALIDDDLMIDFSPGVEQYKSDCELDLSKVKNILITHTHRDHYNAGLLTDFCENSQHPHNKLCEILGEDNIITAFDGMEEDI